MDPNQLTLSEIQRRIYNLDPSLFRQVMHDLKYDGDEPVWAKFDFLERIRMAGSKDGEPIDESNPFVLQKEIERLKLEKRDLAAELAKTQNLLKIQVDIDKQNTQLY